MGKILDLNQFRTETFDIKLLSGDIVNLAKPTKKIALDLMGLQNVDSTNPESVMKAITEAIVTIFNNNTNNKKFTFKWIDDNLDYAMQTAIIQGYSDFMNTILSEKNL